MSRWNSSLCDPRGANPSIAGPNPGGNRKECSPMDSCCPQINQLHGSKRQREPCVNQVELTSAAPPMLFLIVHTPGGFYSQPANSRGPLWRHREMHSLFWKGVWQEVPHCFTALLPVVLQRYCEIKQQAGCDGVLRHVCKRDFDVPSA